MGSTFFEVETRIYVLRVAKSRSRRPLKYRLHARPGAVRSCLVIYQMVKAIPIPVHHRTAITTRSPSELVKSVFCHGFYSPTLHQQTIGGAALPPPCVVAFTPANYRPLSLYSPPVYHYMHIFRHLSPPGRSVFSSGWRHTRRRGTFANSGRG